MGESAHTLYVAHEDGAAVALALVGLLGDESYRVEGGSKQVGLWRPGSVGWTVVETIPPELLLERPLGSREPRIATLARRLGCGLFYLAVYDGAEVLLVEADARRWAATGAGERSEAAPNKLDRDDPRVARDGSVPRFVVLEASEAMRLAVTRNGTGAVRAIAKLCAAPKAALPFASTAEKGGTPIVYARSRGAGARVRHTRFGDGTVLDELGGDPPKLSVAFDDGRHSVLLARFVERLP